jgi:predicted phosphoribosyltransferase
MDFTQTSDREVRDLLNQQGGDVEAGAGHGPKR